MAYVNVPKDLNKVKNKILFNITKRQLICLAVAFVVGVPFYFLTKGVLGTGNAQAIHCYNTCYAMQKGEEYFLVDAGGGNGILSQLDKAGIPLRSGSRPAPGDCPGWRGPRGYPDQR